MKVNKCILIGQSVRALAESAVKGGIEAYTADMFADQDTVQSAVQSEIVEYGSNGFIEESLLRAIEKLDPACEMPVVYGSGLESTPELLGQIAKKRTILGCSPEAVAQVTDPEIFFGTLLRYKIPFPETSLSSPVVPKGWIRKTAGGSGGSHIQSLERPMDKAKGKTYFQKLVEGLPISVTVFATKYRVVVVGYSSQFSKETPTVFDYTYTGAMSVNEYGVSRKVRIKLYKAAVRLTSRFRLRGFFTLDTIIEDEDWYVLEINPRIGATFELHEGNASYLRAHIDSCVGKPFLRPRSISDRGTYRASLIVHAPQKMVLRGNRLQEEWIKDKPAPGTSFKYDDPVCTVHASASTTKELGKLLMSRFRDVHGRINLRKSSKARVHH